MQVDFECNIATHLSRGRAAAVHETRNLVLIILLVLAVIWALLGWFVFNPTGGMIAIHRFGSLAAVLVLGGLVWYALNVEDKLPNHLAATVGSMYYEADGLSFLPTIRVDDKGRAELSLYYQNRYENYAQGIIHLRPPEDSFVIRPGMRDVHFAFKANGGDFGVLHQPIGVPKHLQGEVIEVEVAASSRFPRSHGTQLRKEPGMPCGTLSVDWLQAFKVGVHEVSGDIELTNPCHMHLSMPRNVAEKLSGPDVWRQELIEEGPPEGMVMG